MDPFSIFCVELWIAVFLLVGFATEEIYAFQGNLKVHIISCTNLDRADQPDRSDPYVRVVGHRTDGGTVTRTTSTKSGENPVYNEDLHFGSGDWTGIGLQAMDGDSGWSRDGDDAMTAGYHVNFNIKCDTVNRHMVYNNAYHMACTPICILPAGEPGQKIEYTYCIE